MPTPSFLTARHTDATRQVARWPAYLYGSRVEASPTLSRAAARCKVGFQARTQDCPNESAERRRMGQLAECLGREVFSTLYDAEGTPALDKPAPGTEWVSKAHQLLEQLPEFDALRSQVHGDPDLAAMATAQLLEGVAKGLPAMLEQEKKQAEQQAKEARGRKVRGPKADPEGALRRALRAATGNAQKGAAAARMALEGLEPGMGCAPAVHDQDDAGRMQLAERITSDPRLQQVMKLAGRLQRLAASGRKERDELGCSTLVGVTLGGDLPLALPTELGLLKHRSLRRLQLAKLADRRLQQYHLVGEAPKGRGPVVVLLDESGSMGGDRSLWASAVALACISVAVREKRACTVIGFNGGLRYAVRVDAEGKGWRLGLHGRDSIAPGQEIRIGGAAQVALHVATSRPFGGTSFDPPLRAALALEDGVINERADLVLVTDGYAEASASTMQALADAKAERGLRCFGLTVGGGSLGHAVQQLCDSAVDLDAAINADDGKGVAGAIP